jgi:hypothetical protein
MSCFELRNKKQRRWDGTINRLARETATSQGGIARRSVKLAVSEEKSDQSGTPIGSDQSKRGTLGTAPGREPGGGRRFQKRKEPASSKKGSPDPP